MTSDPLLERARSLWESLAAVPVSFAGHGTTVIASPDSQLCPQSWAGIVELGESAIVTVPTEAAVEPVARALKHLTTGSLTDPQILKAALPVREILGPATLAYVSSDRFLPIGSDVEVEQLAPGHPDLRELEASVSPEDADEGGIGEITGPAFVVREGAEVVAAAGYQLWPRATAHLCVLTATTARGRGLARSASSAAVAHALANDLLPQWRARPAASRRVALALGFRELGAQLSVRLDPDRLEA
ncbi:MAG TPA: GNAT family N-acetyltransferase [Glycomyces sp.]